MSDLPIIQKTYDLIKWYIPILNRLPRDHKFMLGERMITGLYDFLVKRDSRDCLKYQMRYAQRQTSGLSHYT